MPGKRLLPASYLPRSNGRLEALLSNDEVARRMASAALLELWLLAPQAVTVYMLIIVMSSANQIFCVQPGKFQFPVAFVGKNDTGCSSTTSSYAPPWYMHLHSNSYVRDRRGRSIGVFRKINRCFLSIGVYLQKLDV